MKVVEQSIEVIGDPNYDQMLWNIEAAARNCYKIRGLAGELLYTLSGKIPIVFDDLREKFIG